MTNVHFVVPFSLYSLMCVILSSKTNVSMKQEMQPFENTVSANKNILLKSIA